MSDTESDMSVDSADARTPNRADIEYLIRQLCGFHKLRDEFLVIIESFGMRVAAQAGRVSRDKEFSGTTFAERLRAFRASVGRMIRFLALVPQMLAQRRQILGLRRSSNPGVILATASARLHGAAALEHPREYFAMLARQFDGVHSPGSVEHAIRSAAPLYICEPQFESHLRTKRSLAEGDIVVLDVALLIFLGALSLAGGHSYYLRPLLRASRDYAARRGISLLKARIALLATGLFCDGYRWVFGERKSHAFFLTSNSFATELLRFYLIVDRRCVSICELMHGIPTTMYERYLAAMLDKGADHDAAARHSSIPQLPHLPMFGALEQDVKSDPSLAINSYLNSYWMRRGNGADSIEVLVRAELQRLQQEFGIDPGTLVITFFGGMSQHRDCFRSESFATECRLMSHACRVLRDAGRKFVMIYAPHPGYRLADFQAHEYFKTERIRIYPDTVFTWLISDMCMALYSSALFEAAFFGVHAFTPAVPEDDLFPAVLLDMLSRPRDREESYLDALSRFLETETQRPGYDLVERAIARAALFQPWQRPAMK